jgi:plasmid stabilization system protein ParE
LDAAIAAAIRNPEMFALVTSHCRRVLLRRFPFSMVYRVLGGEFLVIAVFHHHRDPAKLARRSGR